MSRPGRSLPDGLSVCTLLVIAAMCTLMITGCFHSDPEPVRTDRVVIPGAWVFEPEVVEAEVGTTVTWVNDGGQAHTVTFDGFGFDEVLEPGETTEYTFEETGTFDYECRFHRPDMVGTVVVVEENATAAGSA